MSTPAAAGITVHRCVVRVVRRGGWSWGPDPQNLVQQVVDALPDLLAERFAEHPDDDGPDLEVTEPVRVTVRLGRSSGVAVIAPAHVADEPVVVEVKPVPAEPVGLGDAPAVARVPANDVTPATLFAELAERDELAALLALLPDTVLVTYATALLRHALRDADGTVIGDVVAELARRGSQVSPPADRAGLLRLLGSLPDTAPVVMEAPRTEAPDAGVSAPVGADPVAAGETRVCGALPFLLAGQLARTGYLGSIGPALAGIDLLGEAPLFAAALAYKVLGAPARGLRWTGEDHATAAAFAGLDSVPDLSAFAQRAWQALPVLDGVLALNVCRGHDPADPLVITGVDGGLLLVDAQGTFPISWAPDVAGLLPHWTACGRPPVAVCDSPLPAGCLRALASAGVGFVTDVRPCAETR